MEADNAVTMSVEIAPATSIRDVADALAQMLIRTNEVRASCGEKPYTPTRISIDMQVSTLSDVERKALQLAQSAVSGTRFDSPEEVRQLFQRSVLDAMFGSEFLPESKLEGGLEALAEAVIKSRMHCNF